MEKLIAGRTASRGIAMAPVYYYKEVDLRARTGSVDESQAEAEAVRFEQVRQSVIEELGGLCKQNPLFAAHQEIARDAALRDGVVKRITVELKNTQQALEETVAELASIFEAMDDTYMKERAADIRDVGNRMMARLKGVSLPDLGGMTRESILVARDLFPSDTVKWKPELVKGILTEEGGITSHVSILAKSMNIPILVGVKGILDKTEDGMLVCMDAKEGTIVIDPDEKTRAEYLARQETYEKEQKQLEQLRTAKTVTLDGKRIFLCVNAGSLEDIRQALPMQIDGVGLFRSEFLYMEHSHFPTEEEQFMVYREAARLSPGELTIRTLDIGGDKALSYFPMEKEANPFLGWRGIRISLDKEELFKEQIRAILRAGAFGHVRLLFPMIISMDELYRAKALVQTCKEELRDAGMAFDETMRIGMMIETPASVLLAEEFAAQVDFFSIGTNDLTQYILAVDRGNKKLSDRYDWMHPAVLRAIQWVIEAGHKAGIQVGMCGEMASSAQAIPVLLKMGLDEFSMSAGNLDDARRQILGCSCTNTDSWKNMIK